MVCTTPGQGRLPIPDRYRGADPRNTYHYITGAMDILRGRTDRTSPRGMVSKRPGYRRWRWATGDLVMLVGRCSTFRCPAVGPAGGDNRPARPGRQGGMDYTETAETIAMREQVAMVNEGLSGLVVRQFGKRMRPGRHGGSSMATSPAAVVSTATGLPPEHPPAAAATCNAR